MVEKRKRTDRALGQDPFEDMEGMIWDESEDEAGLEAEPMEPAPPTPPAPSVSEGAAVTKEAKPEVVAEEGDIALPDEEPSSAASVEAEGAGEGEAITEPAAEETDIAVPDEEPSSAVSVEAESAGEGEAVAEPAAEDFPPLEDLIAAVGPEAEGAGEGEVITEPEVEDFHLLDELIAAIDGEVEEAFGRGAMTSLAPEAPEGASNVEQHVIFSLAGTDYAVPITNVTEIGQPLDVTPVPNVPDWLLGVTNLRGDIVSVIDMRLLLGMEPAPYSQDSRMMVAHARREDMTTSLIVDRVSGIRYLSVDQIGTPTAPIEDQVAPYLEGVCEDDGHLLVVLDFDRLLLSPGMQQFQPL